jgi:hypothetical protein
MIDLAVSGFFLVLSMVYLFLVKDMSFGSLIGPKSGFMPIIAGVGALVLSAINFYKVARTKRTADKPALDRTGFIKLAIFVAALVGYLGSLKYIGFFPATFIVLFFLIKLSTSKWWMPLIVSLSVTAAFYLVFSLLLGIQLP